MLKLKTLAALALVLPMIPAVASADLSVHRRIDSRTVILEGSDVASLQPNQKVRFGADGAKGRVLRIEGDRAFVLLSSTDFVVIGDPAHPIGSQLAGKTAPSDAAAEKASQ